MEEKVYAYLQQHQGMQPIDSVACALECSVPAVLDASISLKNKGLIKMRLYPNGKYQNAIALGWTDADTLQNSPHTPISLSHGP